MSVRRITPSSRALGWGRPIVTVGNFDGLHLGHQRIVRRCVERARAAGERAVVVTFDPHPVKLMRPSAEFCCLRTLEQRTRGLLELGADDVAVVRFDAALRRTSARRFVAEILGRVLRASEVHVGPRFRFGHRRAGDFELLTRLGDELDFATHAFRPVRRAGAAVSSTRIREALAGGDVAAARALLGVPYRVDGKVVAGAGRGRTIGYPTANLRPDGECLPAVGVYGTRVEIDGRLHRGATFLGQAATFDVEERTFETHLLDYAGGDLYRRRLAVDFVCRVRDPERFPSVDALRTQLGRDLAEVRRRVRL